jgi:hypothetical protein
MLFKRVGGEQVMMPEYMIFWVIRKGLIVGFDGIMLFL